MTIEHIGDTCPVDLRALVRVDLGDGDNTYVAPAGEWDWGLGLGPDGEGRILRYEVLS